MQLFDDRDVTVPGISKRAKIADFLAPFDGVKLIERSDVWGGRTEEEG